jgi:hypothetical protein
MSNITYTVKPGRSDTPANRTPAQYVHKIKVPAFLLYNLTAQYGHLLNALIGQYVRSQLTVRIV